MHYRSTRQEYILYMYLHNTHSYISRAEFTKKSTETNIFIINLSIKMHSAEEIFKQKNQILKQKDLHVWNTSGIKIDLVF